MEPGQQLKGLLQLQLASDSSVVIHLAYTLQVLDKACFSTNPHLPKWSARIASLLHSKNAGARWAGLCLAHKSSLLSKNLMIDSASSWLPLVLPLLSRNEGTNTTKAAIRLLVTIFTAAVDMPEFQRQISLPNIAKFTAALASIASTHPDFALKSFCLGTIAQLIPIYPNAHRATFANLSSLALGFLNGCHPCPTDPRILRSASDLYSSLHLTGGKVGAAAIWRKSMDDTLAFGWNAYFALRTTFPSSSTQPPPVQEDPAISIPLNLDRLRCSSAIIQALLNTSNTRPVQISCGQVVRFGLTLLSSTQEDKIEGFADPAIRASEVAAVSTIWKEGCNVIQSLTETIPQHMNSYLPRICTVITYHLEQPTTTPTQRLFFLDTLYAVHKACPLIESPLLSTRMVKAILPFLTVILHSKGPAAQQEEAIGGSKKSRKRTRNYEGDEIFKVTRDVICTNAVEARIILRVLEVLAHSLKNPNLAEVQVSLVSRVLLSIQLAMGQMSASTFSLDPVWFDMVHKKIQGICTELASSSSAALHRATPLIVASLMRSENPEALSSLDLLIHPRLPPMVRPIPPTQSISLFRHEESQEEADARDKLNLDFDDGEKPHTDATTQDVEMEDRASESRHHSTIFTSRPKAQVEQRSVTEVPPFQQTQKPTPEPSKFSDPHPAIELATSTYVPPAQKQKETTFQPLAISAPVLDEEENQEMPEIDMASDSEDEE
ncbi:hypothetical protein FA15DRAFT_753263 [Coprinopsis marcescibilis]|uniref:Pre-rRNA-processing protein RIX1 N-terminal domain-containing protein n=1 Tax=Coprinopsis marcescibilis TaxID=230819 RepID=A0A5C3LA51_COPMA|nr:hypothetical protein FA15DRAFT_753263 [Coprinopsis marcescibilis]